MGNKRIYHYVRENQVYYVKKSNNALIVMDYTIF